MAEPGASSGGRHNHEGKGGGLTARPALEPASGPQTMSVTVVICVAPRHTQQWTLDLPAGAVVADALQACLQGDAWRDLQSDVQTGRTVCGIWGRALPWDTALQDQDRVEIYRPLKVDPKVARRERFAKQGARTTGLFSSKRPGAKAGY
jgi:putative ubiquitin-RnfH superfamily antitoxin RatB of RatAB toxin-antitoxin module